MQFKLSYWTYDLHNDIDGEVKQLVDEDIKNKKAYTSAVYIRCFTEF